MVQGFLILLFFQLVGELMVIGMNLPLPGPVIGLVLLVIVLIVRGRIPAGLTLVGDGLLRNLALLFIPAGVGLVLHFELLAREWWIILCALIASTLIATVVTAILFQRLMRWIGGR